MSHIIEYIIKHTPCKRSSIDSFSLKTCVIPPADYVDFCLTNNGGQLAPPYCDYTVASRYPSDQFSDNGAIGVQWLCGMGLHDASTASFQAVEGNEETLKFCGINSSDFWVIGIGEGNDGYLMKVSGNDYGKIYYCYFDSGEYFPIAESFSNFLKRIETNELEK